MREDFFKNILLSAQELGDCLKTVHDELRKLVVLNNKKTWDS